MINEYEYYQKAIVEFIQPTLSSITKEKLKLLNGEKA